MKSQNDRLDEMRKIIEEQRQSIRLLEGATADEAPTKSAPLQVAAASNQASVPGAAPGAALAKEQPQPAEAAEEARRTLQAIGAIRFSGDLRFRFETFDNQGFDALTEPAGRRRMRVRARLALDGTLNKNFDWGFRLASGLFTDPIALTRRLRTLRAKALRA